MFTIGTPYQRQTSGSKAINTLISPQNLTYGADEINPRSDFEIEVREIFYQSITSLIGIDLAV